MATAKKLPSGSWRCRVFSHYEYVNGKKKGIYESFTCADPSKRGKKECERMAAEWAYAKKTRAMNMTVHDAIRDYIDTKEGVLSPATISGYEKYLKNGSFKPIDTCYVRELDERDVQAWISSFATTHSAKYARNIYRLLTPAIKLAGGPEINCLLPSGRTKEIYTPSDQELQQLLEYLADDSKYELRIAVMLAAFGSLRRSEICALETSDFRGNTITVSKAMVRDKDGFWVVKQPKTPGSHRTVVLPSFVVRMVDLSKPGKIMSCNPDGLTSRFKRAIKYSKIDSSFTLHSLRHYYVSIAHVLHISDAYTMKMGGWSTDYVMKKNYRTTFSDQEKKAQGKLDKHFERVVKKAKKRSS